MVEVGCVTCSGALRFRKRLDSTRNDPASAEQPIHFFSLGDHGCSLEIREAEFQSAHLWTADGDDYFNLMLNLAVPLTLTHSH